MSYQRPAQALSVAALTFMLCVVVLDSAAHADRKVRLLPVPEGGQAIAAKTDARGTIHLLYHAANGPTTDGPKYARSTNASMSTDTEISFSTPIAVVQSAARKPGLVYSGWDMAVSQQGHVHVALGTNAWKLKLPKDEWAFYYARLDPGADAFSDVANLNHKPSEGFSLAADDAGHVAACWLSGKLYVNLSRDNGHTFAPAVEIDPAINPCDCCTTSAVYAADGRLAVLYREETNNDRDMYLALWNQARGKVARTRVSTTLWNVNACPMTYFSVTRNPQGLTAAWPTKGEVFFARLDGNGGLPGMNDTLTAGAAGMRSGVLAVTAADGSTLVAWKKDGQLGWQLYDRRDQALGSPGAAKSPGDGVAGVVDAKGEFILFR